VYASGKVRAEGKVSLGLYSTANIANHFIPIYLIGATKLHKCLIQAVFFSFVKWSGLHIRNILQIKTILLNSVTFCKTNMKEGEFLNYKRTVHEKHTFTANTMRQFDRF